MIIAFTGAGISKDSGISTFMENPAVRGKLFRSYAISNPKDYRHTIKELYDMIVDKQPNDAHRALAEYQIPVITMNIDGLHEKAGSTPLLLHGTLPTQSELEIADQLSNKPVLYGDPAPNYQKAYEQIYQLNPGDTLLVIGASSHTAIAVDLREIARYRGAQVIEIQLNAATEVRKILKQQFS